jgi:hypothetical protein
MSSLDFLATTVVHFKIQAYTKNQQFVFISGSSPQLGEWNWQNAVEMKCSTEEYEISLSSSKILM